jgi:bifunctional DNA-binding transcriptional regulator/antitoxin component of YhaV-PrlF toxin-antitoxin module
MQLTLASIVTVSGVGTVTLPSPVRKQRGMAPGDRIGIYTATEFPDIIVVAPLMDSMNIKPKPTVKK